MVAMGNNKNEKRIKIGDRKRKSSKNQNFVSFALGMRMQLYDDGKVEKHNT